VTFSDNEPAVTAGVVVALATAVLALLIAFKVPITDDQRTAILGVVAVLAPFIAALIIRAFVTPTKKVDQQVMDALTTTQKP
jgi:hypothetical protein